MRHSLKKMTARLLVLVMVFSCLSITAFAAGEVEAEVVTNTIRGEANTDNFSTLKEHIGQRPDGAR